MATITTTKIAPHAGRRWWRQGLLGCGIVASVWWVAMDMVGSLRYPGYSYIDQTISELGVEERMNAYASMLWFAVLAVGLLRAQGTLAPR